MRETGHSGVHRWKLKKILGAKVDTTEKGEITDPLEEPSDRIVWSTETASNMLKKVRRSTRPTIISLDGIPGSRKSDIINILAAKF